TAGGTDGSCSGPAVLGTLQMRLPLVTLKAATVEGPTVTATLPAIAGVDSAWLTVVSPVGQSASEANGGPGTPAGATPRCSGPPCRETQSIACWAREPGAIPEKRIGPAPSKTSASRTPREVRGGRPWPYARLDPKAIKPAHSRW